MHVELRHTLAPCLSCADYDRSVDGVNASRTPQHVDQPFWAGPKVVTAWWTAQGLLNVGQDVGRYVFALSSQALIS